MALELTGIERQLVLQYLIDGNVPVTVTEIKEKSVQSEESAGPKKVLSGVFPVAIHAEQMTVLDKGIILLQNPPDSIKAFNGKKVKVQFYFNKLGLYFETSVKAVKQGLAIVIPAVINKVEEVEHNSNNPFTAILYYEGGKNPGGINIKCPVNKDFQPFVTPKWSDVPDENQAEAKVYLEKAVMTSRSEGTSIGNGLQLISVCRYLASPSEKNESIQDRKNPSSIIYIDHERIVFANKKDSLSFITGNEYAVLLSFPIKSGPIKERSVYLTFLVDNIFEDKTGEKACAVCHYNEIKAEDQRYLQDMNQ